MPAFNIEGPEGPLLDKFPEISVKEQDGKFWVRTKRGEVKEIDATQYSQIKTAKETGMFETAMVNTGDVLLNAWNNIDKATGDFLPDRPQLAPGALETLNEVNPGSAVAGQMLPYLAAAPLYSGGVLSQGLVGAGEGLMFAKNPSATDALFGFAGGAGVAMADRIVSNMVKFGRRPGAPKEVREEFVSAGGKLSADQKKKGREGWRDVTADILPTRGSTASKMGRENQAVVNQSALEMAGLPPADRVPKASLKKQMDSDLAALNMLEQAGPNSQLPRQQSTAVFQRERQDLTDRIKAMRQLDDATDKAGNVNPDLLPRMQGDPTKMTDAGKIMVGATDPHLKPRMGEQGTIEPMWSKFADLALTPTELGFRGASNWFRGQGPKGSGYQEGVQGLLAGILGDVDEDYKLYGYGTGDLLYDTGAAAGSQVLNKGAQAGDLLYETGRQVWERATD